MSRRRRILRRFAIAGSALLAFVLVLVAGSVIAFYEFSDVPSPQSLPLPQVATITYADGSVLARIATSEGDRTIVPLAKVPVPVRWDVLSAEDRNFYNEPGVSLKGTLRAALRDVVGGDVQGGSTITQQYAKNAYLSDSRTLTRKLKELAIAVKLDRQYAKNQILEFYLNTVYFGRGVYGIQAAAQAYFGIDVDRLTVEQGAVLAALLRDPGYYDPATNPAAARARWQYVIDGMVSTGHLTAAQAAALGYPAVRKLTPAKLGASGPAALIVRRVLAELAAHGIAETEVYARGLRIQTTIDKPAQADAIAAIRQAYADPTSKQANLKQALVAVNPASGGVLAYYGGSNGTGFDYAQAWRQAGSAFKPYVLATALSQNLAGAKPAYTLRSAFDGSSPQTIDGFVIHNDPSETGYGRVSLHEAMTASLNTVYYHLAFLVGPANVAKIAHAAGVAGVQTATAASPGANTLQDADGRTGDKIGIGGYEVRPIDQAIGFATFADGGTSHDAHFVQEVTDSTGKLVYRHADDSKQVIGSKVANDVTLSMEQVARTSGIALDGGRPVAAKTGTVGIGNTRNNSDAWTVGYTPQVSVASWAGSNTDAPIYNDGGTAMYGRQNPGRAWQLFVNAYLDNKPSLPMATTQLVGAPRPASPSPPPTSRSPRPPATPLSVPASGSPAPSRTPRTSSAPESSAPPAPSSSTPPPPSPTGCLIPAGPGCPSIPPVQPGAAPAR